MFVFSPDAAASEGRSSAAGGGRLSPLARIGLFCREEATGWTRGETALLAFSCVVIALLSLYWQDSLLGVVSSMTGVAYTVCNGKGKRCAYLFGLVNSVLYACIAFNAQIYGDAILYLFYYLPAMIVGFALWSRHVDARNLEVAKRLMGARGRMGVAVLCAAGTIAFGFVLRAMGDAAPFLDSFTTVVSAVALLVSLGRYIEQWSLWTAVNAAEVVLWIVRLAQGGAAEVGSSLVMWALFLFIGLGMWVRWARQV